MLRKLRENDPELLARAKQIRDLTELRPYIKNGAAFLIYLFKDERTIGESYKDAGVFISNLTRDIAGEEES